MQDPHKPHNIPNSMAVCEREYKGSENEQKGGTRYGCKDRHRAKDMDIDARRDGYETDTRGSATVMLTLNELRNLSRSTRHAQQSAATRSGGSKHYI